MNFIRSHHQATAGKSLVLMSLAHIYDIVFNVSGYDEQGILVSSDVQTLALADGIELRPLMASDDSAVRIGLVTGLPDMVLPGTIGLRFEFDVFVSYWFRETYKLLISKGAYLVKL